MYTTWSAQWPMRRLAPRIDVMSALCNAIGDAEDRFACIVDLSPSGLRIERPYAGGRSERTIQLEFEIPGVDEWIWALGEVCSDSVRPVREARSTHLIRRTGIRLVRATGRDLRLLREYVLDASLDEHPELTLARPS